MVVPCCRRRLAAVLALCRLAESGLVNARQWSVQELRQYHCLRTGQPFNQRVHVRRRVWAQPDAVPAFGNPGFAAVAAAATASEAPCEAYWHLQGRLVNVYTVRSIGLAGYSIFSFALLHWAIYYS